MSIALCVMLSLSIFLNISFSLCLSLSLSLYLSNYLSLSLSLSISLSLLANLCLTFSSHLFKLASYLHPPRNLLKLWRFWTRDSGEWRSNEFFKFISYLYLFLYLSLSSSLSLSLSLSFCSLFLRIYERFHPC